MMGDKVTVEYWGHEYPVKDVIDTLSDIDSYWSSDTHFRTFNGSAFLELLSFQYRFHTKIPYQMLQHVIDGLLLKRTRSNRELSRVLSSLATKGSGLESISEREEGFAVFVKQDS